jgi:hypothetical protein
MAGKTLKDLSEGQQDILTAIQAGWPKWKFPVLKAIEKAFNWYVNTLDNEIDDFLEWLQNKRSPDELLTVDDVREAMKDEKAGGLEGEPGNSPDSIDFTNENDVELAKGSGLPGVKPGEDTAGDNPRPAEYDGAESMVAGETKTAPRDREDTFVTRNISPYDGPIKTNSRGTHYLMHHGVAYVREDVANIDTKTLDEIYRTTLGSGDEGSPDRAQLIGYLEQEFDWASSRPKESGYNPLLD